MLKIYISHSIRGRFGLAATKEQMKENCQLALTFTKWLREQYPDVDWYCPAEHEDFVQRAYDAKYLTEEEILAVDCSIIESCDGVLFYMPDGHLSRGMQVERDKANDLDIPITTTIDCNPQVIGSLLTVCRNNI